jgi:hypothetical protein
MKLAPSSLHRGSAHPLRDKKPGDRELRHDRIVALLIVIGVLTLIALVIWLATFSNSAPTNDYFDTWMIP